MLSHLLEGITGFGCTVIALPFLTLVLGIKTSVQLLCLQAVIMAIYIVSRSWKSIQWKEFLFIVICVGLGMPIGMTLFRKMSPVGLCIILACFMIGVGIHGLIMSLKAKLAAKPVKKSWYMSLILFCGGIIHGAFGTGGPFVVIYASKALPDKSLFRVTLSMLWLTVNGIRLIEFGRNGLFSNAEIMHVFWWNLPFMVVGIVIGDWLHHKTNALTFRLCLYGVLAIAGCVMLISNIIKLLG